MSEPVDSNTLKSEEQLNEKNQQLNSPHSAPSSDPERETSSPESTRKRKQSSKCKSATNQHHHHHHHHHLKSSQNSSQHSIEEDKMSKSPNQVSAEQLQKSRAEKSSKALQQQLQLLVNTVDSNVAKLTDKDGAFSPTKRNDSNMNKSTNVFGEISSGPGATTHTLTLSKSHNYPNHCHTDDSAHTGIDKLARKKLIIASILCLLFMIGETVGGLLANSLAIATDAAHLLTDFASFMISLFSIWMASRPASKKMSFGYYRAEVIGALTSVLLIWVVTGILVLMAVQRLISGEYEIDAPIMLITAGIGVLVNIVMGISLQMGGVPHGHHGHTHDHGHEEMGHSNDSHGSHGSHGSHRHSENLNVRAAFIHVIGDFIQSLGVLIAAAVIYFNPHLQWIDPVCTFFFSILVLITTFHIIRDVTNVLMEGIPKGIDFLEVQKTLFNIPGVIKVHNLRVWSLSLDKIALSAHLAIGKNQEPKYVLRKASKLIKEKFNIFDLTIQVEEYKDEMQDCTQCNPPNIVNENSPLIKK